MEKRIFNVSVEVMIFENHKLINKGICKNTNGLKDYAIIKTFEKDKKIYTIKEKYYSNNFFSKEYSVDDNKDYYVVSSYICPSTKSYWKYDTREEEEK